MPARKTWKGFSEGLGVSRTSTWRTALVLLWVQHTKNLCSLPVHNFVSCSCWDPLPLPSPPCVQEFDDPRDADDAVYELNGRELLGERCTPVHATKVHVLHFFFCTFRVIVEHSRGTSSGYGRRYGGGGGGDRYDRGRDRGRGYVACSSRSGYKRGNQLIRKWWCWVDKYLITELISFQKGRTCQKWPRKIDLNFSAGPPFGLTSKQKAYLINLALGRRALSSFRSVRQSCLTCSLLEITSSHSGPLLWRSAHSMFCLLS